MFRRLENTLPPDFDFPTNLTELGYFINDNDQIRMIEQPDRPFHYWISKNERYIQRHREAFHQCLRDLLHERLMKLSLDKVRLPLGTPVDKPHVPVWVSNNIATCKRMIVYIGESHQDLGVFAGRIITNDGVNQGSAVSLVQASRSSTSGALPKEMQPGIVIANAGQLLWHRRGKKSLTWESWYALKRSSAVGSGYAVTAKNKIPCNEGTFEHVASVFEEIVLPQGERECEIFVIAVGDTAHDVFDFLQTNWALCAGKVQGLTILASNYVWQNSFEDEDFGKWFGERARAYLVSDQLVGTPLQGRSRFGCNVYSGGEPHFVECLMRSAHPTVLDYFKLISQVPHYVNTPQDMDQELDSTPNRGEEDGWGDEFKLTEAQSAQWPMETTKDAEQASSREPAEATPSTPTKKAEVITTVQESAGDLVEGFAGLGLTARTETSIEHPGIVERVTTAATLGDERVPSIEQPLSRSPEESPTGASVYSHATSQARSVGYATPPEQISAPIGASGNGPPVDAIGASIRELIGATEEESSFLTPSNGPRRLDTNVHENVRMRSVSAVSVASTASPPPPPPNSTPETGLTPEPDHRMGIDRSSELTDDGHNIGYQTFGGAGVSYSSLLRDVLQLGETIRVGADGSYDTDEAHEEVGAADATEVSEPAHSHDAGNGKADG